MQIEKRKICAVTGSRAEYDLLYPVLKRLSGEPEFLLQVAVTGMHLSPEFGLTYRVIEKDGFRIDEKIEMLLSSDTPAGVAKSIGLGIIGFAGAFSRLKPDLVLLCGDRFEIFAAAQAALPAGIPVAHIAGGDITAGAFDESIRHCITKMSHLHFATNALSAQRVRQMGENPAHVFITGSPALDQIRETRLLAGRELEEAISFRFRERNILVTFHPATLDDVPSTEQLKALLEALDAFGDAMGLIFTMPNADNEGRALGAMINRYVERRDHAVSFVSLGRRLYWSTMAHVDAVVGNSSSGIYEAPAFAKPAVNIGGRQKGRLQAPSVINCRPAAAAIAEAIKDALARDCAGMENPYGDGYSAARIVSLLKSIPDYRVLVKKGFWKAAAQGEI